MLNQAEFISFRIINRNSISMEFLSNHYIAIFTTFLYQILISFISKMIIQKDSFAKRIGKQLLQCYF